MKPIETVAMTTQISAENLSTVTHNHTPVITTDFLAQLYGTDAHSITKNHRSNVDRFIVGKHFFKLEGAELKEFKNKVTNSDLVANRAKHLILWTERGAARHAKMLETDQAWEVFEKLEDCYFNHKEKALSQVPATTAKKSEYRYRVKVTIYDDMFGGAAEILGRGDSLRDVAAGIATDLGYKPNAFTHVPMNRARVKRIH